ncbi:MAG: MFS transporter [Acidimicrobiia bacterium]|nr:MFS transporter [Acidimicrobiia bacterium]
MAEAATLPSQWPIDRKRRLAFVYYATVLFEGLMLASIGPTLDALADQSGSTTEAISILFTANGLGYISGSLLAGRLYGRVRSNTILSGALLAMAAFTATIPILGSVWLLALAFGAIGVSIGLIDVGGNTLIVWLFRKDVPPYMNALHLSFGIGALLCPLIVDRFAVATDDALTTFWLFAALMVPVALWLTRQADPDAPVGEQGTDGRTVVRRYGFFLGLMAILFFMHMGAELTFGGWVFSYAEELEIGGQTTARVLNSVFWGGLVVGRLLAIPLSLRFTPRGMLQLDLIGAGASLGLIALFPGWELSLWIGTAGLGMAIASVFASCINYAEERMPITSQVTAIFLIGGSIGSMTLPWMVGQLFDRQGPESMLWVVGGAIAVGFAVFVWIQALNTRRGHAPRASS